MPEVPHVKQLERFKQLKQGWDSYGAAPISARAIEIATYLSPFLADWHISPCSNGMIQFEKGWDEIIIDTFNPDDCDARQA